MAQFHFRLQPLLDGRRRAEEQKLHRYAVRKRERDDALSARDRLVSALARRAVRSSEAGWLASLDAGVAAQQRRAADAQAALENARGELAAAARERSVLEKLRERRLRAHADEEARREELEIEEANARRRPR